MECGGEAHLAQPIEDDDVIERGDVLVYLCGACAQRWDVVVEARRVQHRFEVAMDRCLEAAGLPYAQYGGSNAGGTA